jgi:hypothetical protein
MEIALIGFEEFLAKSEFFVEIDVEMIDDPEAMIPGPIYAKSKVNEVKINKDEETHMILDSFECLPH